MAYFQTQHQDADGAQVIADSLNQYGIAEFYVVPGWDKGDGYRIVWRPLPEHEYKKMDGLTALDALRRLTEMGIHEHFEIRTFMVAFIVITPKIEGCW